MKQTIRTAILSLTVLFAAFAATAKGLRTENTFSSCSYYLPAAAGTECSVTFRKAGQKNWQQAFPPVYAPKESEFRGSIVWLEENTEYEVKATVTPAPGAKGAKKEEFSATLRTWNSSPKVGREVKLSSLIKPGKKSVEISGLKGSPEGWIRILPDCGVEAGAEEYAVTFADCQYILFEGVKVQGGLRAAIFTTEKASDVRIINCDISHWGRMGVTQSEIGDYVDAAGNRINNDGGIRIDRTRNLVVERCWIHDPNGWTNAWSDKIQIGEHAGKSFKSNHPKGPCGIFVFQNGGNLVIRYNDIVGSQTHRYNDVIEGWRNGFVDGGFYNDADIYGNMMAFSQDDVIELDGGQCNVRLFQNRMEQTYCGISTAPNMKGPSYIFENVVFNPGASTGSSSAAVKNGGGLSHTVGRQFFFNNTMVFSGNGMRGVGYGPTPDNKREMYRAYTRNNIFLSLRKSEGMGKDAKGFSVSDMHHLEENDFDYDMIANSAMPDGRGAIDAREGSEAHGVFAAPKFTDLANGVFTLTAEDPGLGKGQAVTNFNRTEKAPDLGAFQRGASSLLPVRPLAVEADRYHVRMEVGKPVTVTLKVGDIGGEKPFKICMSEDMGWLEVGASATVLRPNSSLKLTFTASKADIRQVGAVLVRLENGLSVPFTVFAEVK